MKRYGCLVLFLLFAALAAAAPAEPPLTLQSDHLRLEIDRGPFSLRLLDPSGRVILRTDGPLELTRETDPHVMRLVVYWLWTRGIKAPWVRAAYVVSADPQPESLTIALAPKPGAPPAATMKFSFADPATLRVETAADDPAVNRLALRFRIDRKDHFFGMGERFNSADHRRERVRNWSEEGGLGLNWVGLIPPFDLINPFPQGPDMTYCPIPYFLNPDKNYAFLLDDNHYAMFDFGVTHPTTLRIENWGRRFDFLVFTADSPLGLLEKSTARTGRITAVPPPWVFAPMNAVVTGEDRVREVARLLRENHIPTSVIWSESWWWRTEFVLDRGKFPHYEQMIADLHAASFKHLSYFQPYLSEKSPQFAEAASRGFLTQTRDGAPYLFSMGFGDKAQIDLFNPAAVAWWQNTFFAPAEKIGVDGWMHDFGEHTPPYSVSFHNLSGWDAHNEYPLRWARAAREFWDRARPDHDYCFYMRGGYTGIQKYCSVMWTGDQNTSFEMADGLASNIPGILSLGISGHPIVTTDIAGYNCYTNLSANREVFMRWTEFGALLPVMRLHRGNDEFCHNWNFDQDPPTLAHYKTYAILHTSLFPYFYTLAHEAAATGWPIIRHLMLHFPHDPHALAQNYEFLIGDRLLAAPVIHRHAVTRTLYLPEGQWLHWWTNQTYTGPATITIPAPLGQVPLFLRSAKILPLFDSPIDTLTPDSPGARDVSPDSAQLETPALRGWSSANSSLQIIFFGLGSDALTLWDGTQIACAREEGQPGSCQVTGPVQRKLSFIWK